jgi:peptidoglycan hydrolase-like protein with peptidoglycan-binding domain
LAISEFRSQGTNRPAGRAHSELTIERRRRLRPWHYAAGLAVLVIAVLAAAAIALKSSNATLTVDSSALARITMPLGGGKVQSIKVTNARGGVIPVNLSGDPTILPIGKIAAHERVSITVVIKRPGWLSWLTGSTERLHLSVLTPSAKLRSHYLTLRSGAPLELQFKQPVAVVEYGLPGARLHRLTFSTPQSTVSLGHVAAAGSMVVSASLHPWERARTALISWFPAGAATASAVATPSPGTPIKPTTPITLTFSKPISKALGSSRPAVTPATAGSWRTLNTHAIQFVPSGYGYGLATPVSLALPAGVRLVGGEGNAGTWTVPQGSTLRLQQLLAMLGYLPVKFTYAGSGVGLTPSAEEAAAVDPPKGSFSWRYRNTPAPLKQEWQPGAFGTMTKGAIMAFEENEGMDTDGVAGGAVWKALIDAIIADKPSTFGYTFVQVSEGSPETESTWHNGRTVVTGLVNTGTAAAGGTAQGIFPVFEHALSVTMSGTNPDGSHYVDPGIPYVSYFNGGDALHGYIRASYGFPQSDGCVEMPYSEASQVYPYTPIGTLVDVE